MDLMTSFIVSALASALVVIAGWLIQQCRYYYILYRNINNNEYNVFLKGNESKPLFKVKCLTKKNILSFKGKKIDNNTEYYGEVIFNPFSLRVGDGYYIHPAYNGFGFMKVFINKNGEELYIESPYSLNQLTEKDGVDKIATARVYQAFVWKKIN